MNSLEQSKKEIIQNVEQLDEEQLKNIACILQGATIDPYFIKTCCEAVSALQQVKQIKNIMHMAEEISGQREKVAFYRMQAYYQIASVFNGDSNQQITQEETHKIDVEKKRQEGTGMKVEAETNTQQFLAKLESMIKGLEPGEHISVNHLFITLCNRILNDLKRLDQIENSIDFTDQYAVKGIRSGSDFDEQRLIEKARGFDEVKKIMDDAKKTEQYTQELAGDTEEEMEERE